MAEEVVEDFRSSLGDLTQNCKPLISMLIMLADDNHRHTEQIVKVIETHLHKTAPQQKLPCLYLIDSIIKNVHGKNDEGLTYVKIFSKNIVESFLETFKQGDRKVRSSLYKLRQTWVNIFPNKILFIIDITIKKLDQSWPLTAQPENVSGIYELLNVPQPITSSSSSSKYKVVNKAGAVSPSTTNTLSSEVSVESDGSSNLSDEQAQETDKSVNRDHRQILKDISVSLVQQIDNTGGEGNRERGKNAAKTLLKTPPPSADGSVPPLKRARIGVARGGVMMNREPMRGRFNHEPENFDMAPERFIPPTRPMRRDRSASLLELPSLSRSGSGWAQFKADHPEDFPYESRKVNQPDPQSTPTRSALVKPRLPAHSTAAEIELQDQRASLEKIKAELELTKRQLHEQSLKLSALDQEENFTPRKASELDLSTGVRLDYFEPHHVMPSFQSDLLMSPQFYVQHNVQLLPPPVPPRGLFYSPPPHIQLNVISHHPVEPQQDMFTHSYHPQPHSFEVPNPPNYSFTQCTPYHQQMQPHHNTPDDFQTTSPIQYPQPTIPLQRSLTSLPQRNATFDHSTTQTEIESDPIDVGSLFQQLQNAGLITHPPTASPVDNLRFNQTPLSRQPRVKPSEQPRSVLSQPQNTQQPASLSDLPSTSTAAAATGSVDVGSLLQQLMAAGLLPAAAAANTDKSSAIKSETAEVSKESASDKSGEPSTSGASESKPVTSSEVEEPSVPPIPDLTSFNISLLKVKYPGAIESLRAGKLQCSTCGLRYMSTESGSAAYREHLDWHFREKKKTKELERTGGQFRVWYHDMVDWIEYEEFEAVMGEPQQQQQPDDADHAKLEDSEAAVTLEKDPDIDTTPTPSEDDQDICAQCGEAFEQYFDEDAEEWRLEDAIRYLVVSPPKAYHRVCFEDVKRQECSGCTKVNADESLHDENHNVII